MLNQLLGWCLFNADLLSDRNDEVRRVLFTPSLSDEDTLPGPSFNLRLQRLSIGRLSVGAAGLWLLGGQLDSGGWLALRQPLLQTHQILFRSLRPRGV